MERSASVQACAVCHEAGSADERADLWEATHGNTLFTPLYWWNRKIRSPLWKRPLIDLRQRWRTGWVRGSTAKVAAFAQAQRAELIHTNTITTPEGAFAANKLGLPHVWHLREMLGPGQPFRLPYEGLAFGRFMKTHCSALVANSNASAALIRDWVPPELLQVVPNGIDISQFTPRSAYEHSGPLVVAMVGNLTSRWKKHPLFVTAAGRVSRELNIEFRIYGHDPSQDGSDHCDDYVNDLRRTIGEHGLTDRFRFPGFIAHPAEIMSEIDILVHPADSESFGRIIVEGMAAGLPVVGPSAGGVGEIVVHESTGLLAEPNDAAGIARHIERLARDSILRKKFGQAGRKRAETDYSIAACVKGLINVYERALSTQPGSSQLLIH